MGNWDIRVEDPSACLPHICIWANCLQDCRNLEEHPRQTYTNRMKFQRQVSPRGLNVLPEMLCWGNHRVRL